ncbi:molybdopterin synthase [Halobellus rarus]|uniref:Molybdopterin synthase n=1 Tax=Halobellus rarus TaxID=1126237 RepID=A0ABD6CPD2_9EURY|nr:molybdopterin synthase [Halobellus rarus]
MQLLGVVGPEARTLCERMSPHLDGKVALVERHPEEDLSADGTLPSGSERVEGVDAAYELGEDGAWAATGDGRDLDDVLDDLAATYDHALLVGYPEADVPTVSLDGTEAEEIVIEADSVGDVDTEDALDALADATPHVTLETLVERVKESPRAERAGAIATFTGRVRARDDPDDSETLELTFEKYEGVADDRLRTIESELMEREGVQEVALFHRTGTLEAGEDIVFVVVLAGHRDEAFETVSDGIDRLKDEVPIFKRETTVEEDFWVHDRQ